MSGSKSKVKLKAPTPTPTIEQLHEEVQALKHLVVRHAELIVHLQEALSRKRQPLLYCLVYWPHGLTWDVWNRFAKVLKKGMMAINNKVSVT
jgi:hypothetical protein